MLRLSDVPELHDLELPSGALTATQLAGSRGVTATARAREVALLRHDGFRSSAISAFSGPGRLRLTSVAIELSSPQQAARALNGEVGLAEQTRRLAGSHASDVPDPAVSHGMLVRFSPGYTGGPGGLELLARSGSFLYTLGGTDQPDAVSRQTLERLLALVMSRA